jgi:hypothetical protein
MCPICPPDAHQPPMGDVTPDQGCIRQHTGSSCQEQRPSSSFSTSLDFSLPSACPSSFSARIAFVVYGKANTTCPPRDPGRLAQTSLRDYVVTATVRPTIQRLNPTSNSLCDCARAEGRDEHLQDYFAESCFSVTAVSRPKTSNTATSTKERDRTAPWSAWAHIHPTLVEPTLGLRL